MFVGKLQERCDNSASIVGIAERQRALDKSDELVVLDTRILLSVAKQLSSGREQDYPEDQKHEREEVPVRVRVDLT